jgi:hypothetical protein
MRVKILIDGYKCLRNAYKLIRCALVSSNVRRRIEFYRQTA